MHVSIMLGMLTVASLHYLFVLTLYLFKYQNCTTSQINKSHNLGSTKQVGI